MKEHTTSHNNKEIEVTESYKEEGALTLETLEVASHEATSNESHAKHAHHHKGFVLTTPLAIIIAAVIIAGGLMGYGLITSGGSSSSSANNPVTKILKDLKLNKKTFTACVVNGDMAPTVTASLQDGSQAGVQGTPSTFIIKEQDGVQYVVAMVDGARPEEFFKQAIDQALNTTSVAKLEKFKGKPVDANDLVESNGPTKVYVVEYSDAECPYCISLHTTMKKIRTDYAGKITFVYRHYPLPFHQHAQKEAEMISCAGKLGGSKAYYGFIDSAFDYKLKSNIGFMTLDAQ